MFGLTSLEIALFAIVIATPSLLALLVRSWRNAGLESGDAFAFIWMLFKTLFPIILVASIFVAGYGQIQLENLLSKPCLFASKVKEIGYVEMQSDDELQFNKDELIGTFSCDITHRIEAFGVKKFNISYKYSEDGSIKQIVETSGVFKDYHLAIDGNYSIDGNIVRHKFKVCDTLLFSDEKIIEITDDYLKLADTTCNRK
jgi:hypothetical protein